MKKCQQLEREQLLGVRVNYQLVTHAFTVLVRIVYIYVLILFFLFQLLMMCCVNALAFLGYFHFLHLTIFVPEH